MATTKQPQATFFIKTDLSGICTFIHHGRHIIDFTVCESIRAFPMSSAGGSRLVYRNNSGGHIVYMPYERALAVYNAYYAFCQADPPPREKRQRSISSDSDSNSELESESEIQKFIDNVDTVLEQDVPARSKKPHKFLICPITQKTFVDPVVAADGYTYSRAAFEQYIKTSIDSPVTSEVLQNINVIENRVVRKIVELWGLKNE